MASLFGKNRVRDLARMVPTDNILKHIAVIQTWTDDYHTGTLKTDKETSREQSYNADIFIKILGYKEKPASPYTFEPKSTSSLKQFPDVLISYTDAKLDIANVSAVVELKDASTDLDKPQKREGNLSPVQQAFKYKPQYRNCPFVIVSNFYEFRLYNDNELDFESWTLDELVDPADDYLKFKTFFVLLHANNLTSAGGQSKTEKLLVDLRQEQEEISKKFYEEYKDLREFLLKDIWKNNPGARFQFELAIQKAQTIIDRIVFVCFAEDSGLLPDNITGQVMADAKKSLYGEPFFDHLKRFFSAIDKGSPGLGIPEGYNGGLFAEDKWIDALKISDGPLLRLMKLGKYDFVEDLSVNILGHIFEQSISDLEEIKRSVAQDKVNPFDPSAPQPKTKKSTSKRKKEGVFYTPDFVVRYIVENTVGAFLKGHEARLIEELKLHDSINDQTYARREKQVYTQYQVILQEIRILDPACGSGAFLVYAFDYLRRENERVDAILEATSLLGTDEYIRGILQRNLFGVDVNEESVEITKLSLWLKTASKGKKLTALDFNIRCGNSLIDDPIAGEKTFDWHASFPDIFAKKGGFDVVIGNPPYVRVQNLTSETVDYYFNHYEVPTGKLDISIVFFEKGLNVLNKAGRMAFVSSSMWMTTDYGRKLRGLLSKGFISEIVDFGSLPVFEDASTYPAIFSMSNQAGMFMHYSRITDKSQLNYSDVRTATRTLIEYDKLTSAAWQFGDFNLVETLKTRGTPFVPFSEVGHGYVGDISGRAETFVLTRDAAVAKKLEPELLYPYVYRGNEVFRYSHVAPDAVVIYPYEPGPKGNSVIIDEPTLQAKYPNIHAYLLSHKEDLVKRQDSRKFYATGPDWYRHLRCGAFNYIHPPKLIVKGIDKRPVVGYIEGNTIFNGTNCTGVIIENQAYPSDYIFGLLNSKVVAQYLNAVCPPKLNNDFRYNSNNINAVPIVGTSNAVIEQLVQDSRELVSKREIRSLQFKTVFTSEYPTASWPAAFANWWDLDFQEFVLKTKLILSILKKSELFEFWNKFQVMCSDLSVKIKAANDQIDEEVYKIYGLEASEIEIVEKKLMPALAPE